MDALQNRKNFTKSRTLNSIELDNVTAKQQKDHGIKTSSYQKMGFITLEFYVSF